MGSDGCYAYAPATACTDANQTCAGAAGSASCACVTSAACGTTTGPVCQGTTLYTCAQDSQGCYFVASSNVCSTNVANAIPTCGGTPPACGFTCNAGYGIVGSGCDALPPRPLAPLSPQVVTTRTPKLSWVLPTGITQAHVDVCLDRACNTVIWNQNVTGSSVVVGTALPVGVVYWRLFGIGTQGQGATASPTWELYVPGSHSASLSTSWGNAADFNGDGYYDMVFTGGSSQANLFYGSASGVPATPSYNYSASAFTSAAAIDLNADGFSDLVLVNSANLVVYPGSASGVAASATLVPLTGNLANAGGIAVGAGDVNGDGYEDLLLGGNGASVAVVFGAPGGLSASNSIVVADPVSGGAFGQGDSSWSGSMFGGFAGIGDVNGDGFADMAVGSDQYGTGSGRVYVYPGSATGPASTPVVLDAPSGTVLFGATVAGAGDVNGDGYEDLVVGNGSLAMLSGAHGPMAVHVYLGSATGVPTTPSIALTIPTGIANNYGMDVASAGDVNGDGYSDLLVSDDDFGTACCPTTNPGAVFVYLGGPAGPSAASQTLTLGANFQNTGELLAGVGDTNGDHLTDIAFSAYPSGNSGDFQVFVVAGSTTALSPTASSTVTIGGWRPATFVAQ